MLSDLDAADIAFLKTIIPDGCMAEEFVVAVKFIRPDGSPAFKAWTPSDSSLDVIVGVIEMAKIRLMANSIVEWAGIED